MARLRKGEKSIKTNQIQNALMQKIFGIRESELADEMGLERRTLNNYLRELEGQGKAYKEGRSWFSEN